MTPEQLHKLSQTQTQKPTTTEHSVSVFDYLVDLLSDPDLRVMFEGRREHGIAKYGQPLMTFDGRTTDQEIANELLDAAAYSAKNWLETHDERYHRLMLGSLSLLGELIL